MFIAKNKNNRLYLYKVKPTTQRLSIWYVPNQPDASLELDSNLFPEVKWEDKEPTKVELIIKNHV